MISVAIFADIHGKFLLPFKLVNHYQTVTGNKINWILQCGDMGAFPDKHNMDKATLRHAQNDPDELGFLREFTQIKPEIKQFLDKLNVNMLCVRGNHEDHDFLDKLEKEAVKNHQPYFPIDCYQRVFVCRTGEPITLTANGESLSVVGIGRIGDKKGRNHAQFIQDYERQTLKQFSKKVTEADILITHDKSSDSERGYGSEEIANLLDKVAFSYHFYGHTGEPYSITTDNNGITQSVKIKELEFNHEGKLEEGCMIILEKSGDNITITPVPLNQIIQFMHKTWRYL